MSGPTFLPLVDPTAAPLLPSLAVVGPVLIPSTLVHAVVPTLPAGAPYWVSTSDQGDELDLIAVLNDGAEKVVVSATEAQELAGSGVAPSRIVVRLGESELASAASLLSIASGFYVTSSASVNPKELGLKDVPIYLAHPSPSLELIRALPSSVSPVIPTAALTSSTASSSTHISIADAFLARITSDRPDGLFPTIVSSPLGQSLGLVYSSRESVAEAIAFQTGVYQSRKHGLWRKGETSGATQALVSIRADCDTDALQFTVLQSGSGFCHLPQATCFGPLNGISKLQATLEDRLSNAPEGSYTKRLFSDDKLLRSKIMEEAEELCDAATPEEVAFEMADLVYFAMTRCISKGVSWSDVERALDKKSLKVTRRKGDAKPKWAEKINGEASSSSSAAVKPESKSTEPVPKSFPAAPAAAANGSASDPSAPIKMRKTALVGLNKSERAALLKRPVLNSLAMIDKVKPIVQRVRDEGDAGLLALTKQFDKASITSNVMLPPFAIPSEADLPDDVRRAIEIAYDNVKSFHQAQAERQPLRVETMPGVVCSRFVRPISRVGIYVPGGTAVLPSTAIMLGVPAQVAGCKEIVLATPPRADGSISPEVLYVAKLVGVTCILKAGGAQAVAALAYGTDEVPKVDKIFGPGNQWVTAAKMYVQNDTDALVAIDMPAGPSEVLVIADHTANPVFVASDLLSQAEHGTDSQVVLIAIALTDKLLQEIEDEVDRQARALPRCEIARQAIAKSLIVKVDDLQSAVAFSNEYAPEHLILHLEDAPGAVASIDNAGSVFVGPYSPES